MQLIRHCDPSGKIVRPRYRTHLISHTYPGLVGSIESYLPGMGAPHTTTQELYTYLVTSHTQFVIESLLPAPQHLLPVTPRPGRALGAHPPRVDPSPPPSARFLSSLPFPCSLSSLLLPCITTRPPQLLAQALPYPAAHCAATLLTHSAPPAQDCRLLRGPGLVGEISSYLPGVQRLTDPFES